MEIRNLMTFLQLAERKNFTQTAEALNYSQSTVSFQIKQLEDEIGAPLFERIHNRVSLTEKGNILRDYARQIINLTDEIKNMNSDVTRGNEMVRFAMAPSICSRMMGNTYLKFHEAHPEVSVKIITAQTEEMIKMLTQNDIDIGFIVDRHIYNKDFAVLSEKKVKMNFVASSNFLLANKQNIRIKELAEYPFLLTEKGVSYRRLLDERLEERYLEISPIVEMGDTELLLELVELGVGVSVLPDYITQKSFDEGKVIYLDVEDFEIDVWRQLICHKNKWITPSMKKVIEYCSEVSKVI